MATVVEAPHDDGKTIASRRVDRPSMRPRHYPEVRDASGIRRLSLIEVKRRSGLRAIVVPEFVGHHHSERLERLRHITSIPQPEDVAASAAQHSQDPLAEGSVGRRPYGALRPDGRAAPVIRSADSDTR